MRVVTAGVFVYLPCQEGWLTVMHAAMDARGIDMQPVRDHSDGWAFVFIIFMVLAAFFFVNMFVGVLYERFVEAHKAAESKGVHMLTSEQVRPCVCGVCVCLFF